MAGLRPAAAALALAWLAGCGGKGTPSLPGILTPANEMAGTWKTTVPVTFYYTSDYSGQTVTIGKAQWNMTWTITATDNPNQVSIDIRAFEGPFTQLSGEPYYVPFATPVFVSAASPVVSATVSSSAFGFDAKNISFHGSYTRSLIMGKWVRWDCAGYCSGEYTPGQDLKLVKQ